MDNWTALNSTEPLGRVRHGQPSVWWWSAGFAVLVHVLLLSVWGWMAWTQRDDAVLPTATHWVDWRTMEPSPKQDSLALSQASEPASLSPVAQARSPNTAQPKPVRPEDAQTKSPAEGGRAKATEDTADLQQKEPGRVQLPPSEPSREAPLSPQTMQPSMAPVASDGTINSEPNDRSTVEPIEKVSRTEDLGSPTPAVRMPERHDGPNGRAAQRVAEWLRANPKPAYPAASRRLGEQGVVEVLLRFDAAARLQSASIARSSGFYRLDEAALRAVKNWSYPVSLRPSTGPHEVRIPVVFSLSSP